MKVFAILTACLMSAGGATYYFASSGDGGCPFSRCPVAKTGGCCGGTEEASAGKPECCHVPCPACSTDCGECCAVCEDCCVAGAGSVKSLPTAAKAKSDCCFPGADCCELALDCCLAGACCDAPKASVTKFKDAAKYVETKPTSGCLNCCLEATASPAAIATSAVLAGAGQK